MNDEILKKLEDILSIVTALDRRMASSQAAPRSSDKEVATDDDLDGEWGDPVIRKNGPKWTGESCEGRRMSECPSDFLENYAGFKEWQAGKDEAAGKLTAKGQPTAPFNRREAARARGWAKRNSVKVAAPPAESFNDASDDLPF